MRVVSRVLLVAAAVLFVGAVLAAVLWHRPPAAGDAPDGAETPPMPADFDPDPGPPAALAELPAAEARALVTRLTEVERPAVGLSGALSGRAFAPVPRLTEMHAGRLPVEPDAPSDPFRRLVELGPRAVPYLLEALDDARPTKLKVRSMSVFEPVYGAGGSEYAVKVGDVCYVALGQVVGREYNAVQYIPSGIVAVTSPVRKPDLAAELRREWGGSDPGRRVWDALSADFRARPAAGDRDPMRAVNQATARQAGAAARLLYYYPDEAGPLVAARLDGLRVEAAEGPAWDRRETANGMIAADFLRAVAWCPRPDVQAAVGRVRARATDPHLWAQAGLQEAADRARHRGNAAEPGGAPDRGGGK